MDPSNEASAALPRRLGSYTTAKVTAGRVERVEQHAARLRRDAGRLGLPQPPARDVEECLLDNAREAFGRGDGIVRVEWSQAPGGAPELFARPRPFAPLPEVWRATIAKTAHPGPEQRANTKAVDVPAYDLAREEVAHGEVEEALLFDADGRLVEGSRSNLLLVTDEGRLETPALALGAVEGLGLAALRYGRHSVHEAHLTREDVANARELLAVNVVRGLAPIVSVDGRPIGSGRPGDAARALREVFGTR